jgi:hypothetical protein
MHTLLLAILIVALNRWFDARFPVPARAPRPSPPKPPVGPVVWCSGILLAIILSIAAIDLFIQGRF